MRRGLSSILALAALLPGCADEEGGVNQELAESRNALQPYRDIEVALEEGYIDTLSYFRNSVGGMGIHFIRYDLPQLDRLKPQILIYDLDDQGRYSLIAPEWFLPAADWKEKPTLFGGIFLGPMDGHWPEQPEHYCLHVWMLTENPEGIFAEYNPNIVPPVYLEDLETARDAIGRFTVGIEKAIEYGYAPGESCVQSNDGSAGIPYFPPRQPALGDLADPTALLYLPLPDGSSRLLGAEWRIPESELINHSSLFNQSWHGPRDGYYYLRVWLFETNPNGMFADFNRRVGCPQ